MALTDRRSPLEIARRARDAWRRTAPLLGTTRGSIAAIGAAAIGAGLSEAALLALIASIGSALATGSSAVQTDLGPLTLDSGLATLFPIAFGLALLRGVFQGLMAYLPARLSAHAMAHTRQELFDAFVGSSWSMQASQRDGHFQSLAAGHAGNTAQSVVTLGQAIGAFLMFLTLLASALAMSVTVALMLIGSSVVLFLLVYPLSQLTRRHAKVLSDENIDFRTGIQEVVRMAEEIQVFGASRRYRQSVRALIEQVRAPFFRTRFYGQFVPALYQSVALFLLIVALFALWQAGTTEIAALGAVVLILVRSVSYGQQLQGRLTKLDEQIPFITQLRDSLEEYRAHPRQEGSESLPRIVTLGGSGIGYSYVAGELALVDVAFEVEHGEAIGIVGPSGAGKSTLVQILLRLRDPDTGALRVNGVDARRYRRDEWQARVVYVPQSPQLIHGTVMENIRFFRDGISDDACREAAALAHVEDEILSWHGGYDTIIGERASAVSGGQRQRLCLARALAGAPDVLILDEPTSALDVRSEVAVQESLAALHGRMTLFLVAHRMSTLSICDRVMVVQGGRVQAFDRPDQLMQHNDFYREAMEITQKSTNG